MKKLLVILGLLLPVAILPAISGGCTTTPEGQQGIQGIEEMSDVDFNRLKLYSSLGVKIAASTLVAEGEVDPNDLDTAADVLEDIKVTPVLGSAELLIQTLLAELDTPLTDESVEALLEIAVFELQAQGILDSLNPDGTLNLTPRTNELIDVLVDALRAAADTPVEELRAEMESVYHQ